MPHAGDLPQSPVPEDPILSYMRSNDCERENEELRGIIDDLTLDIKRLKRRLRRYKAINPPQLRKDRLFEIRTHGLSTRRKRQLEDLLKNFTSNESLSPRLLRNQRPHGNQKSDFSAVGDRRLALLAKTLEHYYQTEHSSDRSQDEPMSDDGWVDVNVLIQAVQKETAEVTPHSVTKAVSRFTSRLELSSNGQKLRWKPGKTGFGLESITRTAALDPNLPIRAPRSILPTHDTEKPLPLGASHLRRQVSTGYPFSAAPSRYDPHYRPLVTVNPETDSDGDIMSLSSDDSSISGPTRAVRGNHSERGSGANNTSAAQGSVSYYKDATFCVDLSCDDLEANEDGRLSPTIPVKKISASRTYSRRPERHPAYADGRDEIVEGNSPTLSLITKPLSSASDHGHSHPRDLEASGVGETVPEDNFAIRVLTKHGPVDSPGDQPAPPKQSATTYANKIRPERKKPAQVYGVQIVSSRHEELAPASLPLATCRFFSPSSSHSADDEATDSDDDDTSEAVHPVENRAPESPIMRWNEEVMASFEDDESDTDMSDDEGDVE